MPIMRRWVTNLKSGRSGGIPQTYEMAQSTHNTEMDGDKQKKQALLLNKGRQTKKQPDTEGHRASAETKVSSSKLKNKRYK